MFHSKFARTTVLLFLIAAGFWLLVNTSVGPSSESPGRQAAVQRMASNGASSQIDTSSGSGQGFAIPVEVNLQDIPANVYDPNNQYDRWQRGEIDLIEQDGIISQEERALLQAEALRLPASENINIAQDSPSPAAPAAGKKFDSIDITECCGGGANVPPDPELAVGPNHIIAAVNVAFEIYDKNGSSLFGPTTFSSFLSADSNCTGLFDPNAIYDEAADRFILGIDADGTHYCIAVSQTGDPTGSWNIYSYSTASSSEFFDYPHAGVGQDAIYMGANIFDPGFVDSRVWAFDKNAMYAGNGAAFVRKSLGQNEDTPQPLHLHGWNQNTWPTSGPHYFFTETNYNGANYSVFSWADPFGANNWSKVGTMNLVTATGVTAGYPVDVPQSGGSNIQANDWRPNDFEYRNGYAWTTMTIGCNPGSGTVNCIRWAKINPSTASVIDSGVYASNNAYRTFPNLAVNQCEDMAVGYTKSSSSTYPSIYFTGRQSDDAAGTLQSESSLKAGETSYTAFDSVPHRWGDYTGMTIDPDGKTFWYLGEYSKNTGSSYGRWGTYIGSFSYDCSTPATDTPTPTNTPKTATATDTPTSTNTPTKTSTSTATSTGTFTPTPTNTGTSTATSTGTLTPTPTDTSTSTPTSTGTITPMPTETSTLTPTSTSTATSTPTTDLDWKVFVSIISG